MARVRILDAIRFTSYDRQPGQEVDLPGDIAATWCAAGLAELVRDEAAEAPEQAASAEPETTSPRSRAARSRKSS